MLSTCNIFHNNSKYMTDLHEWSWNVSVFLFMVLLKEGNLVASFLPLYLPEAAITPEHRVGARQCPPACLVPQHSAHRNMDIQRDWAAVWLMSQQLKPRSNWMLSNFAFGLRVYSLVPRSSPFDSLHHFNCMGDTLCRIKHVWLEWWKRPFSHYHHHFVGKVFSVYLINWAGWLDCSLFGCINFIVSGSWDSRCWSIPNPPALQIVYWQEHGLGRTKYSAAMLMDRTLGINSHYSGLNTADLLSSPVTNEIHLEILS